MGEWFNDGNRRGGQLEQSKKILTAFAGIALVFLGGLVYATLKQSSPAPMYQNHVQKMPAFDLPDLGDQSDPIPLDVLQTQPDHPIVQTIMYIYSLEPPFYRILNRACRDKDASRMNAVGPLAAALGEIVRRQDAKREDKKTEDFTVYRGLSLPQSEI